MLEPKPERGLEPLTSCLQGGWPASRQGQSPRGFLGILTLAFQRQTAVIGHNRRIRTAKRACCPNTSGSACVPAIQWLSARTAGREALHSYPPTERIPWPPPRQGNTGRQVETDSEARRYGHP